jgi:hypothetical protein
VTRRVPSYNKAIRGDPAEQFGPVSGIVWVSSLYETPPSCFIEA